MFDIGWTEMLVIAVIAIVVVGPKDLPRMLKTVGQYVGKGKKMAREFQNQFDDAVRDTELADVRDTFNDLKSSNPTSELGKALNPLKEAADDLKNTVEEAAKTDGELYGDGFENSIEGDTAKAALPESDDPAQSADDLESEIGDEDVTVIEDGEKSAQTPLAKADDKVKAANG